MHSNRQRAARGNALAGNAATRARPAATAHVHGRHGAHSSRRPAASPGSRGASRGRSGAPPCPATQLAAPSGARSRSRCRDAASRPPCRPAARSRPSRSAGRGRCAQATASLPSQRALEDVGAADEARHELRLRPLVDVLGRAGLLDAAVVHHDDHVGGRHRLRLVVRHVDRREAELVVQPPDLEAHLLAQVGVEVRQRLVEQQRSPARSPARAPAPRAAAGRRTARRDSAPRARPAASPPGCVSAAARSRLRRRLRSCRP